MGNGVCETAQATPYLLDMCSEKSHIITINIRFSKSTGIIGLAAAAAVKMVQLVGNEVTKHLTKTLGSSKEKCAMVSGNSICSI